MARLIKADVGLQVAAVDYGDWDMHEGLAAHADPTDGWMHDKLTELSGALAAFFTDLGPTLDRTGQHAHAVRVRPTGRGERADGLDHGHGNAVLLLGGGIVGGKVHGTWPGLADAALDDGDLAATTDYRNLIGGAAGQAVRGILGVVGVPRPELLRPRDRPLGASVSLAYRARLRLAGVASRTRGRRRRGLP